MRRLLMIISFCTLPLCFASAQSLEETLRSIEDNNLRLKALSQELEARCQMTVSDANLSNPELEYAFLMSGNTPRHDIAVSQSLDFATITGTRRKTALKENDMIRLEYRIARKDLRKEARELIAEIIFRNAMIKEYNDRLEHSLALALAYQKGYEEGEFSAFEAQRANAQLFSTKAELDMLLVERKSLLTSLSSLNAGKDVKIESLNQESELLPQDFQTWLSEASSQSSAMNYLNSELSFTEQSLKLAKAEAVPSLRLGYIAELEPGSEFRGVKIGLSVPLWSSGKKISAAKKQFEAAQSQKDAAVLEFGIKAKSLYDKVRSLEGIALDFTQLPGEEQILASLDMALWNEELSLINYYTELSAYYQVVEVKLRAQLEYALALAELNSLKD